MRASFRFLASACATCAMVLLVVAALAVPIQQVGADPGGGGGSTDCEDVAKCNPCLLPCEDFCFGTGSCGSNHCKCPHNTAKTACVCVTK